MIKALVLPVTQSATPTYTTDNIDVVSIVGLAQAITSMTSGKAGTPSAGDRLRIEITDNGTAQSLTFGSGFEGTIPTATVTSTKLILDFAWNTVTSKWTSLYSTPGGGGGSGVSLVINEYDSTSAAVSLTAQALPTVSGKALVGLRISLIGPGAGGGSGRRDAAGVIRGGGGGGGASPSVIDRWVPVSLLTGNTWDLNIPQGSAGGAAVTVDATNGNPGAALGSVASFACPTTSIMFRVASPAGGGGGTTAAGTAGGTGTYGPLAGSAGGVGGAAGAANTVGGAAGGGGGGAINASNVAANGAVGGANNVGAQTTLAGAGGVVAGSSPTGGSSRSANMPGSGAGGGAPGNSTGAAAGQAGADAIQYGAGGGGGGASLNGNNSGAGGKGGPGYARLEWVFA